MERNYFIHNSSQEELPPPSQLSVEATTQRELYFDPYSNGKCPRSKCACVRKHWDDCCESIAHIVEEYEERLRDFSIWLPPPVRPSRQRLVDAVAYTYWSAKAEEMDCTEDDLDLHLPLPECMAGFYSNLEAIFALCTHAQTIHLRRSKNSTLVLNGQHPRTPVASNRHHGRRSVNVT
jgi:hypothetical protein